MKNVMREGTCPGEPPETGVGCPGATRSCGRTCSGSSLLLRALDGRRWTRLYRLQGDGSLKAQLMDNLLATRTAPCDEDNGSKNGRTEVSTENNWAEGHQKVRGPVFAFAPLPRRGETVRRAPQHFAAVFGVAGEW